MILSSYQYRGQAGKVKHHSLLFCLNFCFLYNCLGFQNIFWSLLLNPKYTPLTIENSATIKCNFHNSCYLVSLQAQLSLCLVGYVCHNHFKISCNVSFNFQSLQLLYSLQSCLSAYSFMMS